MPDNIEKFVPKNPADAERRFAEIDAKELASLEDSLAQLGFGPADEPFQFRTPEDFASPELVSKWEDLLKELNIPDVFLENEKPDFEGPYRLILEVNETMARDCLVNNFKYINALATEEEKRDYIYANKNLLLYVRRLRSFVNNNPN